MIEGNFTSYSSCFKCGRRIVISYDDNNFETEDNVTFLGRQGTASFSYCPYCGVKQSGFVPYDWDQEMDLSQEDDPVEQDEEWDDDSEPWWPDAEGVTLIYDEKEDDDDSWDESEKNAFICPSCGKKTWLNPKGCERVFCYYCGKETVRRIRG